ncbi:MAG: hypothetical protein SV253_03975 [Halobacteria archaeon]|nr:hypothetical protein [Halobacteria archaeon]
MTDLKFSVAATVVVTVVFVASLVVSESLEPGMKPWGLLASLLVFVLLSTVAGIGISRRSYS